MIDGPWGKVVRAAVVTAVGVAVAWMVDERVGLPIVLLTLIEGVAWLMTVGLRGGDERDLWAALARLMITTLGLAVLWNPTANPSLESMWMSLVLLLTVGLWRVIRVLHEEDDH